MKIYCTGCNATVNARLTSGSEIYPHRNDLNLLPFWVCDNCQNYVGCHHKTKNRTQPLGCIPTAELRKARNEVHKILDPLWKSGVIQRKKLYFTIGEKLGYKFHSANIQSVKEAEEVIKIINNISV